MDQKHAPGEWAAAHQLYLQLLSQALHARDPAMIVHMKASLRLTMADTAESERGYMLLCLSLLSEEPH
jgi:hypothetical protein